MNTLKIFVLTLALTPALIVVLFPPSKTSVQSKDAKIISKSISDDTLYVQVDVTESTGFGKPYTVSSFEYVYKIHPAEVKFVRRKLIEKIHYRN